MARLTIEFDLNDPDDRLDALRMEKASDACGALYDVREWLRIKVKREDDETLVKIYEKVFDKVLEIYDEYSIHLDDICQ